MASPLPTGAPVDDSFPARARASQVDEQLCSALCAYLAENPRAMDTLEGIASWWVARQQIRQDVHRVSRALAVLEARGVVEQVGVAGMEWFRLKDFPGESAIAPDIAHRDNGHSRG